MEAVIFFLNGARGRYIPRDFIGDESGVVDEDHCLSWGLSHDNRSYWEGAIDTCLGHYWDCWIWILNNAKYTTPDGIPTGCTKMAICGAPVTKR